MKRLLLLLIPLWTFFVQTVDAQKLGLHLTSQELAIIRARAISGPYKTKGDSLANTPGDWDRIVANKNAFMTNPAAERWKPAYGAKVTNSAQGPTTQGNNLRDAAFYALVKTDAAVANAVRGELINQAGEATTQYSNTALYCLSCINDGGPGFGTSEWMTRLLYAYDYLKIYDAINSTTILSSGDKTTLNAWHRAGAAWIASIYDPSYATKFVNRASGNYQLSSSGITGENFDGEETYYGGPLAKATAKQYNNRTSLMAHYVGVTGLFLNDATFQTSGKRYLQEWVQFGMYPDGMIVDMHRSAGYKADAYEEKGYGYASQSIAAMLSLADQFARNGDSTLFSYSTRGGTTTQTSGTAATAVAPGDTAKSLKRSVYWLAKLRLGEKRIYVGTASSVLNNFAYRVDGYHTGYDMVHDSPMWALANIYWKDPYLKKTYLRIWPLVNANAYNQTGSRPFPTNAPANGPNSPWTLVSRPAGMLQYATLESRIAPYGVSKVSQRINWPVITSKTFGDASITLNATAGSGLAVTYSLVSGPATLVGSTLTFTGAGTVVVRASQAGNGTYAAAPDVTQSIEVKRASQTITLTPIPDFQLGVTSPVSVSPTISSGLTANVSVSVNSPATVSGSTIMPTGVGVVTVLINQPGNANYLPSEYSANFRVVEVPVVSVTEATPVLISEVIVPAYNSTNRVFETQYEREYSLSGTFNVRKIELISGNGVDKNALDNALIRTRNGSTYTVVFDGHDLKTATISQSLPSAISSTHILVRTVNADPIRINALKVYKE